jgi:tol-pal system protein YbgF
MKKAIPVLLLAFILPTYSLGQRREDFVRLQSDVLQLQELVRVLQKSMDEHNGIVRSLLEQLNDQVAKSNLAMETMAVAVQNQRADVGSSVSQMRDEMQKLSVKLDDTNARIGGLYQRIEETQLRPQQMRPVLGGAGGQVDPDQAYNSIYSDYLMGNFDLAISGFQDFLSTYPDSELADNAAYYLGVSYFDQGRYDQALQAFDQVINVYPQGNMVPAAHFKKGTAFQELQRNNEAIDVLRRLISLFPDSPEANLARQDLQRLGVDPAARPAATPTRRPR